MSLSSGTKTALGEAASWAIAGILIAGAVIYFDELKLLFSPTSHASFENSGRLPPLPTGVTGKPRVKVGSLERTARPAAPSSGYVVKLKAGAYGHYNAPARFNGREINVLVDTGASYVALTHEDAERAGIYVNDSDFKHSTRTANGRTRVAIVNVGRISIGDIEVRNVRATVHEPGKLHVTLLGMSFLSKLRRAEMRRGVLILEQ